jgi:hypothetical protein
VSAHVAGRRPKAKKDRRQKLLWLTEAQAALSWGVLLALAAVLGAIYLHQTSGIARVGRMVQSLQYQHSEIRRANAELERGIARAQSLERLQSEADRLGFELADPEDIEYLVILNYPLSEPTGSDSEAELKPVEIETITEAIFRAFASRISGLGRGESS